MYRDLDMKTGFQSCSLQQIRTMHWKSIDLICWNRLWETITPLVICNTFHERFNKKKVTNTQKNFRFHSFGIIGDWAIIAISSSVYLFLLFKFKSEVEEICCDKVLKEKNWAFKLLSWPVSFGTIASFLYFFFCVIILYMKYWYTEFAWVIKTCEEFLARKSKEISNGKWNYLLVLVISYNASCSNTLYMFINT